MNARVKLALAVIFFLLGSGMLHAATWIENGESFLTGEMVNCYLDSGQEIKLQSYTRNKTANLYKDRFGAGQADELEIASGSWRVPQDGIYYGLLEAGSTGNSWAARSLVGSSAWREYTVRGRVRATVNPTWIGVIAASSDRGYYMVQLLIGTNRYRVMKSNPSVSLGDWQDARTVFKPDTWYTIEITITEDKPGELHFRIMDQNGIQVFNPNTFAKDPDSPYEGGKVGFVATETPAYFSNLEVRGKQPTTFAASGTYTSRVLDTGQSQDWDFVGWVSDEPAGSKINLEVRASDEFFSAAAEYPHWQAVTNCQQKDLPKGRYVQYRATFLASEDRLSTPSLLEVMLSSDKRLLLSEDEPRPELEDLTMSMMYQTTMRKLHVLYSQTGFNASERGVYVLRNQIGKPITEEDYVYRGGGAEDYLAARYGTWIIARIHPVAAHSPLTLSAPATLSDKRGNTITGSQSASNSVDFFNESFMKEYLTGVRKMVEYYKNNNHYVLGYTLAPPEFFYDTIPWPDMKYTGGFSEDAKASYFNFLRRFGIERSTWPAFPEGEISLDRDYYLWVYWRTMEASRYLARVANAIKEVDPQAKVGALYYVGDLQLRGLEPGFLENNPQFDYYYSSNMFPRIPGPDGLTGGNSFTFTRQNVLGHSRKTNLVEHDLWSPYVDLKRHETYERYAFLQKIIPVPIVFGNFPEGDPPSNHLTKYHGMTGEPITLELMKRLECTLEKSRHLKETENVNQVAFIYPSFSLYSVLEKDSWKVNRLQHLSLWTLDYLVKQSVGFDIITEGHASREVLDKYNLVIVASPVIYPWLRDALANTKADVLALGWAGSVAAPGPKTLKIDPDPIEMVLDIEHAWGGTGKTIFPTEGKVFQEDTVFTFKESDHPLLRNLTGTRLNYRGLGLGGSPLPYVGELQGEVLATDSRGRAVYAVQEHNGKKVIHFGGLLHFTDRGGNDASLLTAEQEKQFFNNIMEYCGITYYPDLEPIRIFETSNYLLIENTIDKEFMGEVPNKIAGKALKWPDYTPEAIKGLEIPPYGSIVIELVEQ